jgi:hypothetical protein
MEWQETDTSENGDRWKLDNPLGISVRLSCPESYEDSYVSRIAGNPTNYPGHMKIDEVKAEVVCELIESLRKMMIGCMNIYSTEV